MYVVTVKFELHASEAANFIPLIKQNAQTSLRNEAGCRQFDICVDPENPLHVFLYEIYDDRAAFEMHLATEHFRHFEKISAPMVANKVIRLLDRL